MLSSPNAITLGFSLHGPGGIGTVPLLMSAYGKNLFWISGPLGPARKGLAFSA